MRVPEKTSSCLLILGFGILTGVVLGSTAGLRGAGPLAGCVAGIGVGVGGTTGALVGVAAGFDVGVEGGAVGADGPGGGSISIGISSRTVAASFEGVFVGDAGTVASTAS